MSFSRASPRPVAKTRAGIGTSWSHSGTDSFEFPNNDFVSMTRLSSQTVDYATDHGEKSRGLKTLTNAFIRALKYHRRRSETWAPGCLAGAAPSPLYDLAHFV